VGSGEDWSDWAGATGEIWTRRRPVAIVLCSCSRPVAERIGAVVCVDERIAACVEVELNVDDDGVDRLRGGFDNLHTLARRTFRRRVTTLSAIRMAEAYRALAAATGC
jgi:mRNA-degrading endonuclease toxin of MazEF toxin-antitoxin module